MERGRYTAVWCDHDDDGLAVLVVVWGSTWPEAHSGRVFVGKNLFRNLAHSRDKLKQLYLKGFLLHVRHVFYQQNKMLQWVLLKCSNLFK